MNKLRNDSRRRALRLWLAGQATLVTGAAATSYSQSFIPLALAGSATLMLTVPIVRELARARRAGVKQPTR